MCICVYVVCVCEYMSRIHVCTHTLRSCEPPHVARVQSLEPPMGKRSRAHPTYSADNCVELHDSLLGTVLPWREKQSLLREHLQADPRYTEVAFFSMLIAIGQASRGERDDSLISLVAPECPLSKLQDALDYLCTVPLADRARYAPAIRDIRTLQGVQARQRPSA